MALPTNRYITKGFSPIEKKITLLKNQTQVETLHLFFDLNLFSCDEIGKVNRVKKVKRNIFS